MITKVGNKEFKLVHIIKKKIMGRTELKKYMPIKDKNRHMIRCGYSFDWR